MKHITSILGAFLVLANVPEVMARPCQIRNFADNSVNFYWMDVNNWGNYIKQSKVALTNGSTSPIKTFESHEFFVAWASEANNVPNWKPNDIPQHLRFKHRGFDQVVTARVDVKGNLYVEDWDVLEAESGSMIEALRKCQTIDTEAYAKCAEEHAMGVYRRLEEEVQVIQDIEKKMIHNLDNAWCLSSASNYTTPIKTYDYQKAKVHVLLDTEDVKVYHLRNFVEKSRMMELENEAPVKGERFKQINSAKEKDRKGTTKLYDFQKSIENFVKGTTRIQPSLDEGKREPLYYYQFPEKDFHAPPCDGRCPLLPRPVAHYFGVMITYVQVPPDYRGWKFTTPQGVDVSVKPSPGDAVFFYFSSSEGYKASQLPHLTSCPVPGYSEKQRKDNENLPDKPPLLTISQWVALPPSKIHRERRHVSSIYSEL